MTPITRRRFVGSSLLAASAALAGSRPLFAAEEFIRRARAAGLKFTFGTDARNQNAGRFAYCLQQARACGLTAADLYVVPPRA